MVEEWLDFFRKNTNKKLFSLSDLVLLTGENRSSLSVQLSRMVSSGIIDRPARGWYANPFRPPGDEEVAMVIRAPSYLSMEYALSRLDVLSQNVFTLTLITTRLPYTYRGEEKVFEYHQIKRELYWGYSREGMIHIAQPEKALLDLIYIRFSRGDGSKDSLHSLVDDMYLEDMERGRLIGYSKWFDRTTRSLLSEVLPDLKERAR